MRHGDDGGQLLLLAGIVLVLAFVVTAFTLGQVADVEKQAAKEQDQTFLTEYRFLHSKLPSILAGNTGTTTDGASFNSTFNTTVQSFRNSLAAKGFDAAIFIAGNASSAKKAECMWTSAPATDCSRSAPGGEYGGVMPEGGTVAFDAKLAYDGKSDGLVWMCNAPKTTLVGAVVEIYLSNGRETMAQTLILALNHGWYIEEHAKATPCA